MDGQVAMSEASPAGAADAKLPLEGADCQHTAGHCINADIAEARSVRYVDALRLVALSSGRWAIWTVEDGAGPLIREGLCESELKGLLTSAGERAAAYRAGLKPRVVSPLKPKAPQAGKISIDLGDLFP